jgi:hypothetical protein
VKADLWRIAFLRCLRPYLMNPAVIVSRAVALLRQPGEGESGNV